MAAETQERNMAVFCDFENIAIGAREAKVRKFDIKKVLERLLVKGSIVVKKAYCDWERYKDFKAAMHEASFELIEIPHVRQSGKNSADIRMVVDALDLSHSKEHIDCFALLTGDSDFSPLASKLGAERNSSLFQSQPFQRPWSPTQMRARSSPCVSAFSCSHANAAAQSSTCPGCNTSGVSR